jgi:hypothetical protein
MDEILSASSQAKKQAASALARLKDKSNSARL